MTGPDGDGAGGRRARIAELFRQAIELDEGERDAYVHREAGDDEALLERLRALLAAHARAEAGEGPLPRVLDGLRSGHAASLLREAVQRTDFGPRPGEQAGRYRVIRCLGRGGMGAVYEAHDPVLDRTVALKFLSPRLGDRERLLEEARAASALDHPCIATVHEVGEDERGRSFIAMGSYSGGTLRERLRDGPLPVPEAVRIAVQVADALHAAHARGILHRDVKPENLLFDGSGRVKVADFGIAHSPGASPGIPTDGAARNVDAPGGTIAYMSPEQLRGAPLDGRSDLWALGVVLHEMLTGEHPVPTRDRGELVEVLRGQGPLPMGPLPPSVPPELAAVLARALHRDPDRRHPTGQALARALRRATEPVPPPGRLHRRRGWRQVAVGTALVGGLLAAGFLLLPEGPVQVEASGSAGAAFSPRGLVLVSEFDSPEGLAELALAAREALVVDLQQSGFVRVPSRSRVEEALRRMGHPEGTRVEGVLAREVAERLGAGAVVEAGVSQVGRRYLLVGRALEPVTGEELFSVRTSATEPQLLDAVEGLSRETRARLGEASESLAGSRPLPEVTTSSLEALRAYALAERAMISDVNQVEVHLATALELDPAFAMAHRLAAASALNRMSFEGAAVHLGRAWEHRDRLADRERWLVEAFHAAEVDYDPHGAEELYVRIVSRFPDEFIAWSNLGNHRVGWLHDPEGAHQAFRHALEMDPEGMRTLAAAAQTALILGNLDEADLLMTRGVGASFESVQARWRVTRAFWMEDVGALEEACTGLLAAGYPPMLQADDREVCGSMLLAEGRPDLAVPLLEAVVDDYVRLGRYRSLASALQSLAVADLMDGDTARARGRFEAAMAWASPEDFGEPDRFIFRTNLQVHAALLGWLDLVERIGDRYPPYPEPGHLLGHGGDHLVEAAIALARGDGRAALALLEEAFPPGIVAMGWRSYHELLQGLALEQVGEDGRAAEHFRRALDRGWAGVVGMTKDRLNLLDARAGLERVDGAGQTGGPEPSSIGDERSSGVRLPSGDGGVPHESLSSTPSSHAPSRHAPRLRPRLRGLSALDA
ncbi:MAG: serine/threonine protein kinase [Gemmatimonadales bacterium]|nr:MAG: serine/threonine protein kinase [Gemmatimonadales bacterium]